MMVTKTYRVTAKVNCFVLSFDIEAPCNSDARYRAYKQLCKMVNKDSLSTVTIVKVIEIGRVVSVERVQ